MRVKICKRCKKPFETDRFDNYLCPTCSAEYFKSASINDRTCKQCGIVFPGGPRAWYCPSCRYARMLDADKRRRKNGTARPIGSTDKCTICGNDYFVNSARQRYCKDCAASATAENVQKRSREYNAENKDRLGRQKQESRHNRNVCIICGAIYDATSPAVTCSPECAKKLKKLRQDEADIRRGRRKTPAGVTYDSGLPKSGIVGVTANRNGKWRAAYKGKYLGTFSSVQDAAAAIEKYKDETNKCEITS